MLHPEHRITVYEAADRLGGHSNTVEVEDRRGIHAIDTGFIVFNDRNYPNFEALLSELGVPSRDSHMSFSVSDGGPLRVLGDAAWAVRPPGASPQPRRSSGCCVSGGASTARRGR